MAKITVSEARTLLERHLNDTLPDVSSDLFKDWINTIDDILYFDLANIDDNKFLSNYYINVIAGQDEYTLPSDFAEQSLAFANSGIHTTSGTGNLAIIDYDSETAAFTEGETLTGGTSGATATIVQVKDNGTTGYLILKSISGSYEDNETITDGAGGSATSNGPESLFSVDHNKLKHLEPYRDEVGFYLTDKLVLTQAPKQDTVHLMRYLPAKSRLTADTDETLVEERYKDALISSLKYMYEVWDKGDILLYDQLRERGILQMYQNYRRTNGVMIV